MYCLQLNAYCLQCIVFNYTCIVYNYARIVYNYIRKIYIYIYIYISAYRLSDKHRRLSFKKILEMCVLRRQRKSNKPWRASALRRLSLLSYVDYLLSYCNDILYVTVIVNRVSTINLVV